MNSTKSKFYKYVDDVIDGRKTVGKYERLAVERFIRDCEKKDYIFDYKKGERIVNFTEKLCRHWKGIYAGKPIILLPHQHFYFINLFGWRREDGTRRFRGSYKKIARKQAKTTESAIKGIYLASKDGERGAQIFSVATKEEQAAIVVTDAGKIIEASPDLRSKFRLYRYKEQVKRVIYPTLNSFIKPLGKDSDRQDGVDPSVGIVDEYHAFDDDDLVNVLESGMGMRTQPLIDRITTAGFNQAGPCFKFEKMCKDILEGKLTDDELMIMIFDMDEGDDWQDETKWIKCAPNLADPVLAERAIMPYMKSRMEKALREGSQKEVDFKTKNLNIWCDAPEVWIRSEVWNKNRHGIRAEDLEGAVCYGGLDLSSGIDINAFVLYFPNFLRDINVVLPYFLMPEDLVRENKIHMDYSDWVREGHVLTNPGNIIDHNYLAHLIKEEIPKYKFQVLGFDTRMAYHGTIQNLLDAGIDCQPFSQGIMTVTEPTQELEKLAHAGKLEHFGNPVLRWMMGNVTLRKDAAGNYMIDKGKSQGKIDGVAALIDAIGVCKRFPPSESVYATRGVITI